MGLENNRHLAAIGIFDDTAIERRVDAIKKIGARVRRASSPADLLSTANRALTALTRSEFEEDEKQALLKIVEKSVPSFIYDDGKAHELSLLYLLGLGEAIDVGAGATADSMALLATAAFSGLEYLAPLGEPAREDLRQDLLALSRRKAEAAQSRERESIPEVSADNALEVIGSLIRNAARDREEVDLLWWVINDHSQLADVRLSQTDSDVAAVLSAIESAAILYGPGQRAHRDIATRHLSDTDTVRSPEQFAVATAGARNWARHALASSLDTIRNNQSVLPGLSIAVLEADEAVSAAASAGHAYAIVDWCRRLIDELGLLLRLRHTIRLTRPA